MKKKYIKPKILRVKRKDTIHILRKDFALFAEMYFQQSAQKVILLRNEP